MQPVTDPARPRNHRTTTAVALLLAAVFLIGGCTASRLYNAVAPSVAVSNFSVNRVTFAQQAFTVALKVSNPNPFALPITGIDYVVHVNGQEVADGATRKSFTLPANGTRIVRLSVVGDFLDALRMFQRWRKSGDNKLSYRVSGTVQLAGVPIRLPFTYADAVALKLP